MMRFNSHYHVIIVEGGCNDEGRFVSIPFAGLQKMAEYFRRKFIWLFVEKELINEEFTRNLLSWKHSGFHLDVSDHFFYHYNMPQLFHLTPLWEISGVQQIRTD